MQLAQILSYSALFGFLVASPGLADQVDEKSTVHGRLHIGLAAGPGGSLSPCLKTQGPYDLRIARDDCAETEGVLAYSKLFAKQDGQSIWSRAFIDLSFRAPLERGYIDTTQGDSGLILGNRNFYAEVGNLGGSNEIIWVGNRSYDYEEHYLLDLRVLDIHGPGFGIGEIPAAIGKLNLAFFRVKSKNGGPSQDTIDGRWNKIPLPYGEAKIALLSTRTLSTDSNTGEKKYAAMHGEQLAFFHYWRNHEAENRFFLQFGQGLFGGSDVQSFSEARGAELNNLGQNRDPALLLKDDSASADIRDAMARSKAWRVGNQYVYYPELVNFSLQSAILYEQVDFGAYFYTENDSILRRPNMTTQAWLLRPIWDLNPNQSLSFSYSSVNIRNGLGYKRQVPDGSKSESRRPVNRSLQRTEFAYVLRPLGWGYGIETKLFAAHNQWNPESRLDVSEGPLKLKSSGWTGGVTMGLWW